MSSAPEISVVVPTRDRAAALVRTLGALARQSLAAGRFEVIVVADGCRDGTVTAVRGLDVPYRLQLLEQPHTGAAAARNRGAAGATAALLLFLDDDMEATPGLLAAHLAAQAALPGGGIVLGRMIPGDPRRSDDLLELETRLWWWAQDREWGRPAHRFTARDLFAGNVSMPRALFDAAGGFDAAFGDRAAEDRELGVRLLGLRAPIRFARDAASIHHDVPTLARTLARAGADGRGHVLLARRHPEVVRELPIASPPAGRVRRRWWDLGWSRPAIASLLATVLERVVVPVLARARRRDLRRRAVTLLCDHAYWEGVRSEAGSRAGWDALARAAVGDAPGCREREYDLADGGLAGLAGLLAAEPIDALRLCWRDTPLLRIAPLPAAEPLRVVHVRAALLESCATTLVPLLATEAS